MSGKMAGSLFLVICIVLAVLLMARVITPMISGLVFAAALAGLGIASGGFRRTRGV